jgi:hypothetical protein
VVRLTSQLLYLSALVFAPCLLPACLTCWLAGYLAGWSAEPHC